LRHLAAMRLGYGVLGDLARCYARYIAPLKGLTRKCVVVDLDNTLWGGVVGEDGKDGIKLGPTSPGSEYQDFQRYLLSLTKQGILLAINSKNNLADALEVIRSHDGMVLREDSFVAMRINWSPKSENLVSLAGELNIGLDAMVFLDDSAEEREGIRQMVPEVLTPDLPEDPALYRQTVEALPQLQLLTLTTEDQTRVTQYQAKRERERARADASSLEEYLRSLAITVETARATDGTMPRVHQLIQRTNQFNLTTRRYDSGQLAALARDPERRIYVLRARDRFGDHGVVGTAIVRVDGRCWTVDSFLMSCRVIGYGVETALLAAIERDADRAGADTLVGEFIETDKNVPARDFYERHGFHREAVVDGVIHWRRRLSDDRLEDPSWVTVADHES
jgi:FkbH-like protein